MPNPTALLERTGRAAPTSGGCEMPAYRAPRPGDLLAVRTNDPYDDTEYQVVLDTVVDTGRALLLAGAWRGKNLEVLIRRVGEIDPLDN